MSAVRILLLVLALAAVAFTARYALTSAATAARAQAASPAEGPSLTDPGRSRPARQLDDARQKAKAIEGDIQRSFDKAEKPTEEAQ